MNTLQNNPWTFLVNIGLAGLIAVSMTTEVACAPREQAQKMEKSGECGGYTPCAVP